MKGLCHVCGQETTRLSPIIQGTMHKEIGQVYCCENCRNDPWIVRQRNEVNRRIRLAE